MGAAERSVVPFLYLFYLTGTKIQQRNEVNRNMKQKFFILAGCAGSIVSSMFGGWDTVLQTLVLFMGIDWITGGILLPVVFRKSPKSENGRLESRAGFKGICRKCMILFYVLIAAKLDLLMQTNYLRDMVCIGFIINELLSIVENAALMGLPMPGAIKNVIDILKMKESEDVIKWK